MGKKILVVDDEPDVLTVTSYRLRKSGYEIGTAPDGPTALAELHRNKPDLVLLDMRMPGMDGIDVCRHIKQDESLKDVPVVFLTASTDVIAKEKVQQAGGDGLLLKPCDPSALLETLRGFIG